MWLKEGFESQTQACNNLPLTSEMSSHGKPFSLLVPPHLTPNIRKQMKEVAPILPVGGGARSAAEWAAFPGAQRAAGPLTDRCVCTWACTSCSAARTTWPSSATWARRTSPRASGWAWSSEAPRARTTARWAPAVTSPANRATACWYARAASPTAASTALAWWMKAAEGCRNAGGRGSEGHLRCFDFLFVFYCFRFKLLILLCIYYYCSFLKLLWVTVIFTSINVSFFIMSEAMKALYWLNSKFLLKLVLAA